MRHRRSHKSLSRDTQHRRALLRNLAQSLFEHEKVRTTLVKAKEVKPFAERMITLAKKQSIASRRRVTAELRDREVMDEDAEHRYVVQRLFNEIAPRYADRPGGYTRIVRLPQRRKGDDAAMCVLQLVEEKSK